jgi:hypothetical protein
VDPKTFFSDSDPQKFFSDSDTDTDSDSDSDSDTDSDSDFADIYFGTNHSKVFLQRPTNIFLNTIL